MTELYITPHGKIRDAGGETFRDGNGAGVLALLAKQNAGLSEAELYFRRFAKAFVTRMCNAQADDTATAALLASIRPGAEEFAFLSLEAPPMTGGEFLDAAFLLALCKELEQTVIERAAAFGGVSAYLRSLGGHWKDVGKISFHLAENKSETKERFPFVFMASFIHRLGENDTPKHLPLAAALKAYAQDRAALKTVLAPIQKAAERSEVVRRLLDTKRIFRPTAWTSGEAYLFLKDIPVFEEANIVTRIANLWKRAPARATVTVSVSSAGDPSGKLGANSLLQFAPSVTIDGEPLTPEELRQLMDSKGGLVRIRGQWVEAEPDKIRSLLERFETHGELSFFDGMRLLSGMDSATTQESDEVCRFEAAGALKETLANLRDPASVAIPALPGGLDAILRHYQIDGVKFLWLSTTLGLGACLADDMGLGKTLQVLALAAMWHEAGALADAPALLVMPATLLANWRAEAAKFTPHLRVVILHPSYLDKDEAAAFAENPAHFLRGFDLAFITYGMLTRTPALSDIEFPAVVADEAQAIKNPGAKQSKSVRSLRARARIALTGTPVENRVTDLWSLFDFINPGLLGNITAFKAFVKASDAHYAPLRTLTRPFILRRLKTDKSIVPDLPDKTELKAFCALSRKQAALYEKNVEALAGALASAEDGIARTGLVLSYLMRFKQICNHPAHFSGDGNFVPTDSGKFLRLTELAETIAARQEKLLVFTQFREMTDALHEHLAHVFRRPGLILHGGTPVGKRAALVRDFQSDDGPPFFVLSLKAAGTGLNLTAANHVVHFDRWWNPAVENQASDRAFRIGQKRNVLVHKFVCTGTLEEKIDALIADKQDLADTLLGAGAEKLVTDMNNAELLNFVRLDLATMEP